MPDSLAACDWSRSSKWRVWEDQNIFAIRLTRCACFVGARPPRASLTFRRTRPQEPPRNSRCTPRPSPTCPPPLSRVRHRNLRDARSPRARHDRPRHSPLRRGDAIGDGASPRASRARLVETTGRNTDDDPPHRSTRSPRRPGRQEGYRALRRQVRLPPPSPARISERPSERREKPRDVRFFFFLRRLA